MSRQSRRSESGFSTIEVLVALVLIALVGLITVQAASGGRRAAAAGNARVVDSVRLLQLDTALRQAVGGVRVPYWTGTVEAVPTGSGFSLPFLDGEEAHLLRVEVQNGWIVLDTDAAEPSGAAARRPKPPGEPAAAPAPPRRLGPFAEAAVEPVFEDGQLWGVKATVKARASEAPVELRARVGSRPLSAGEPQ